MNLRHTWKLNFACEISPLNRWFNGLDEKLNWILETND